MRSIPFLFILAVAACGGSSAGSRDTADVGNADPSPDPEPLRADGRLVIELAPVTSDVAGADALDSVIREAAVSTIATEGTYATDGGRSSYRLDIKVAALDLVGTTLTCKLSVTISTEPKRAIFGMANASATAEADAAGVPAAQQDCVRAVIDSILTTNVIPTLSQKH